MTLFTRVRRVGAALLVLPWLALQEARADTADYAFQLVDKAIHPGAADIALRLVKKAGGEPIPEAVIFSARLDMAPDHMETMTAPVEALPSTEPGIYRFKLSPSMTGNWRLSLRAKIQGETGTLSSDLTFKVEP